MIAVVVEIFPEVTTASRICFVDGMLPPRGEVLQGDFFLQKNSRKKFKILDYIKFFLLKNALVTSLKIAGIKEHLWNFRKNSRRGELR